MKDFKNIVLWAIITAILIAAVVFIKGDAAAKKAKEVAKKIDKHLKAEVEANIKHDKLMVDISIKEKVIEDLKVVVKKKEDDLKKGNKDRGFLSGRIDVLLGKQKSLKYKIGLKDKKISSVTAELEKEKSKPVPGVIMDPIEEIGLSGITGPDGEEIASFLDDMLSMRTIDMEINQLGKLLRESVPDLRIESDFVMLDRDQTEIFVLVLAERYQFRLSIGKYASLIKTYKLKDKEQAVKDIKTKGAISNLENRLTKNIGLLKESQESLEDCAKNSFGYNLGQFAKKAAVCIGVAIVGTYVVRKALKE